MLPALGLIPLVLYFVGFAMRRRRSVHIWVMGTAIALDLVVVALVETERHVVKKVVAGVSPLLRVHVGFALSSLALCALAVVTGARLYYGKGTRRPHKTIGYLLLFVRSAVSVTYFMVKYGWP
jgi:hypothetical protein